MTVARQLSGAAGAEPGAPLSPMPQPAVTRSKSALIDTVCLAQFMVILDMTVVTVALPSIGRSLRFAPDDLQWVVTAYLLATGGLTLLGGRAADVFGGRRMFGIVFSGRSQSCSLRTIQRRFITAAKCFTRRPTEA